MKKKNIFSFRFLITFTLFIILLISFSCQTPSFGSGGGSNDSSSDGDDEIIDEGEPNTTTLTFVTRDTSSSLNNTKNLNISGIQFDIITLPMDSIDKVYFRSSDIEFWSINSIGDIDDLMSAKYVSDDASLPENLQKSIYVGLPDIEETFVFIPGHPSAFSPVSKPVFEKKKYNLIRLDIGGGGISFVIDDELKIVLNSDGDPSDSFSGEFLNCNSIFLIDQEYLDQNVYITRNEARNIESGASSGFAVIDSIIRNSNYHDSPENGIIDVDGALFISFEAIDFNDYASIENITVDVSWDMNNLLTYDDVNDEYRMQDRVEKTCFDFNVDLIIE